MSFGTWIRDELLKAGSEGVTVADLHKKRIEHKEVWIDTAALYKGGTYNSFARYFHWLKQLGFVEPTGRKEPSKAKGNRFNLKADRCYYKISDKGRRASELDWLDPIRTLHPEWTPSERKRRYVVPTGRPRGRPRREWG